MFTGRVHSRRKFLQGLGASAVGLGLAGCSPNGGEPPDVVVLVLDSLRARSLPMYGHSRKTAPFLEDLTRHSILFERCYAAAAWTRPSVSSILSGLPPLVHKAGPLDIPYPIRYPSFALRLGEAGYHTGFFTANTAIGESFGMESQFDHVEFGPAKAFDRGPRLTEDCAAWLETLGYDQPTLVYIHYHPPHGPYHPPKEFVKWARSLPPPDPHHLPHHRRGSSDIALAANVLGEIPWYQGQRTLSRDLADYEQRYEANIAFADSLAAGFFATWRRLRGDRHTIFFVTGDHGEGLGEHGLLCDHGKVLMDEILHVPLLVHDTRRPVASSVGRPVSHLDIGPTILDLGGVPGRLGIMNEPLFEDGREQRVIVSNQEDWSGGEYGVALTSGRWRLVYNPGARWGGGHLMEVSAGNPDASTLTGVPLPLPSTALRGPVELTDGAVVEGFALHAPLLIGGARMGFSGTVRTPGGAGRVALRVRAPDREPELFGPFGAGEIGGEIPDVGEAGAGRLIVEAAPWIGAGPVVEASGWRRLLSAPVLGPTRLNQVLEIVGTVTEPAAACPGDSVHITLHWRAHQNPGKDIGAVVELVGSDGSVAIRESRRFFQHYPDPHAAPRPLLGKKKVNKSAFSRSPLDFDDAFWWTLPTSLDAGRYQVRVGLIDYRELFANGREIELAEAVPAGTLEISGGRAEHLRLHLRRDLGIENLRLPWGFFPEAADIPVIRELARRFPDQGHLDFLLASHASTASANLDLLRSCVRTIPFHRPALTLLSAAGAEDARDVLERLTPSNPRIVRFGDIARLTGYDLCRGEACVYLTLYWEADAATSLLLGGKLKVSGRSTAGDPANANYSWFIGGEQRPTSRWRLGETVVETVRVPVGPEINELAFALRVAESWRDAYSGRQAPFLITSGNGAEMRPVTAELGSFRVDDLELCTVDFLTRKRGDPGQCVLVDLLEDPYQKRNLVFERRDVFSPLHRQLGAVLALGDSPVEAGEDEGTELSEDTEERLRALGYID